MGNNLIKKFASFSFGTWIGLIIGVVSTPMITRLFKPEDFAKASMFNLAINILMIFVMLATDQAYVRFFYEEKDEKRKFLLRNVLIVPTMLYVVTGVLIYIFKEEVSIYLFGEKYISIICLLIGSIFIYLINRFANLVIRMEQQGKIFSFLQIGLKLFELIGILLVVAIFGNSFKGLIYARVGTIFLVCLIAIYYGRKHWNFFKGKKKQTKHSLKDISNYSMPLVLTSLISWLFQSFDRFAIKQWGTMNELGVYVAGFRIVALLVIIQTTFATFWTPVSFEHYEKNPEDRGFYTKVNRIITIVMMLVAVGTIMFKDVIILLLGKDYREASMVIPFLVFMPLMYTISETTVGGIGFKKKVRYHLVISIVACISNIVGNYLLVPTYGGKGAAISTGIAYIIFFTLRTYFSVKCYKVDYNLKSFYFYTLLLGCYALYNTFYNNYWIVGIGGVLIGTIILLTNYKFIKDLIKNR